MSDESVFLRAETALRTHRPLELEFGKSQEFDDSKHERRRLFSELSGTSLLVLFRDRGSAVNAQSSGAISRAAAVRGSARLDGHGDRPLHGRRVTCAPEPGRQHRLIRLWAE
jgi:hypothetical protein